MQASGTEQDGRSIHTTKKCYECLGRLPLNAEICEFCKKKVGDVNKDGFAEKPIDWKAYILSVLSLAGLGLYIWWLFFKDSPSP